MGSQVQAKYDSDSEDDIAITTVVSSERDKVPDYKDSSPPLPNYINSSDVESYASVTAQAIPALVEAYGSAYGV